MRMLRQHCALLLIVLAATTVQQLQVAAVAAAAAAPVDATPLQRQKAVFGRKLLQPYVLNNTNGDDLLPQSLFGRINERRVNDATRNVVAPELPLFSLLDLDPLVQDQITASAERVPRTGATNLNFGGVSKRTYQMDLRTDESSASTSTAGDVRAISHPSFGRSGARVVERSASLAQKRLAPAGPVVNSTEEERPQFVGQEDDRPLGSWDVLATAGVDYAFAGDYSAFTQGDYGRLIDPDSSIRQTPGGAPEDAYGEEESDYGQISAFPDSSVTVTSRTDTTLDSNSGRAAAFVRSNIVAQAPNNLARGNARSSALWGMASARRNDDVFGAQPVIQPAVPYRRSGAGHAASMRGTTYKNSQRPAFAMLTGNAGTVVSRNGTLGGASDQLNYVAATQWSAARSQNVALGSNANIDFEVGKRRRAATHL